MHGIADVDLKAVGEIGIDVGPQGGILGADQHGIGALSRALPGASPGAMPMSAASTNSYFVFMRMLSY
jgi:hypothetical protein